MLEQFLAYIEKHKLIRSGEQILIGASGGVDSTVLIHLMHAAGFKFALGHMNFRLRGDAADADETFVSKLAEKYNVPFFAKRVNTKEFAKEKGISTQMAARELRYAWFEKIKQSDNYAKVAIGTHLNDQLETVLLNLSKETGINGLTGITPKRDRIIRPLLPFSRNEIEAYADAYQIKYRVDASNADVTYQRNRIRNRVIPELEKINPALMRSFANTLSHLSEAASFLEETIHEKLTSLVDVEEEIQKASKVAFSSKHGNLLLHTWLAPFGFSKDTLTNVLEAKTGALFQSASHTLNVADRELILVPNKSESPQKMDFRIPCSSFHYSDFSFSAELADVNEIDPNPFVALLNPEAIQGELYLKSFEPGDRIQPLGMKGFKKLSDLLSEAKIPRILRNRVPILCDEQGPVWVVGHTISDRVKLVNSGKKIYLITVKSIR
jgi:tRNA(Ile)-lysidine synthase